MMVHQLFVVFKKEVGREPASLSLLQEYSQSRHSIEKAKRTSDPFQEVFAHPKVYLFDS